MNAEPLTLSRRTHSLFWKEWRQRRGLIVLIFALGFAIELAGFIAAEIQRRGFVPDDIRTWLLNGLGSAIILLGGSFLSREENDAADCWLYTLPVSRARIASMRILLLTSAWIPMTALVLAAGLLLWEPDPPRVLRGGDFALIGILCLAVLPLASTFRVHLSQPIVVFVVTVVVISLCSLPIYRLGSNAPGSLPHLMGPFGFWITVAGLFAVFSAWLVFLISHTRIQELPPLARAALGILYGATVVEAMFVLFLADPYELLILLTGGFGG